MMRTGGYVLVGGRSSRFGEDKALFQYRGKPLGRRIAEQVALAASGVKLVGRPERYASLGFPVIADAVVDAGPLGGIVAALDDSEANWNLIVACDLPLVTGGFLKYLLHRASLSQAEAVVPLQRDGRPQALCAAYAGGLAGPLAAALAGGQRKVTDAIRPFRVEYLRPEEYRVFDPRGDLLVNINEPSDRERWLT